MPKQRNHPHHHGKHEGIGLGFHPPTAGPFEARNPLNPTPYSYPKGWIQRPWYRSRSWTVRKFMFLWMAGFAVAVVLTITSRLGIGR